MSVILHKESQETVPGSSPAKWKPCSPNLVLRLS